MKQASSERNLHSDKVPKYNYLVYYFNDRHIKSDMIP